VESATPNIHADQIEWMTRHLVRRDSVLVSLHTHNDRGTAVAASELGLLAGADRVEGTLFGNGERTGNLDIVTMALNMYSQGIDSGLDFSDIPAIADVYRELTDMMIHARQPYAGDLVYTAFSGSHQDAIKKGMDRRAELLAAGGKDRETSWEVPYLPIDPRDIGRTYEAIIRINSQSGKGGVAYILKERKGMEIPKAMRPELGAIVNKRADELGTELKPEEVWDIFEKEYLGDGYLSLIGIREISRKNDLPVWEATVKLRGKTLSFKASGNGPIDSFARGLAGIGVPAFKLVSFHEDALASGSDASAAAYIEIESGGKRYWGCGISPSVADAGVLAEASAVNRMLKAKG
jgi:2-isopropylmalate synthase